MSPRQLFRVGAALIGLWHILLGMLLLLDAAMMAAHIYNPPEQLGNTMYSYGTVGGFRIFMGFLVMCGFPAFDRMAFPRHHRESADDGTATDGEQN